MPTIAEVSAEADVVVVGRPMAVTGDTLELQVEQVLACQARVGYQRVAGMDTSHAAEAMTPGTLSLLFLRRTPQGLAFTNTGQNRLSQMRLPPRTTDRFFLRIYDV